MLQSDVRKVSAYKAEMQEIIYSKNIMEDNEMTKVDRSWKDNSYS